MKRFFSMLLVLCMLLSLAPLAVSAEDNSDSNRNALELFGFPLDPDSYDTQAIKAGTYPVSPKYDLYVNDGANTKNMLVQVRVLNIL